jgi:uridylate kinase
MSEGAEMPMRTVIKLGHSFSHGIPRADDIRNQCDVLRRIPQLGHGAVVVIGGGDLSRDYISVARKLGAGWSECDQVGIDFTRLNARLFVIALGESAYPRVAGDLQELVEFHSSGRIVVMGGMTPGQSTDAVGALAAEAIGADLFVRTLDVEGIYDRDPKGGAGAKRLESLTIEELRHLVAAGGEEAGQYKLLDHVAINILARSRIPAVFIDGRNPENILKAIGGEKIGTSIVYR